METILHVYNPHSRLLLLEYANKSRSPGVDDGSSSLEPSNVFLFVGGLYDNFRSPEYIEDIAALFPRDAPNQKWRVMHVQLCTSDESFGLYDLDWDVGDITIAINYIRSSITRSRNSPIVLMGHSTGCQDLMHYLVSPVKNIYSPFTTKSPRPVISGAIFQAPVSDREALLHQVHTDPAIRESYEACLAIVGSTPAEKHATTILPLHASKPCMGPAPLTITRFLSLASPGSPENPGMDDYYSSDLSDQRLLDTFGRIGDAGHLKRASGSSSRNSTGNGSNKQTSTADSISTDTNTNAQSTKSVLFLPCGSDENVPSHIDKAALLSRWKRAIETSGAASMSAHSQIIQNALHDISGSSIEARTARLVDMRGSVLRYLDEVVGDIGDPVDDISSVVTGTDTDTRIRKAKTSNSQHPTLSPWAIYQRDRQQIELERGVDGVRL